MAPKLAVGAALLLAASTLLAGCIQGQFFVASIPDPDLQAAPGWSVDTENNRDGEESVQPIAAAKWSMRAYAQRDNPSGHLLVIGVSDTPIINEQEEIEKRLEPYKQETGAQLTERGRGTASIRGDTASYVLYDARVQDNRGNTVDGKAIDLQYTCGANKMALRVFGSATTKVKTAVFTQDDLSTWHDIVGTAFDGGGALGGLLSKVRCS